MAKEHIKIQGHIGRWYEINSIEIDGKKFYLMEHETYGDMAPCIIIDEDDNLILEDVWNGFDDLYEYFEEFPKYYDVNNPSRFRF